ncbi:MAG: hypothetical protein AAFQ90_08945 [Pseudomonadota bacterium]
MPRLLLGLISALFLVCPVGAQEPSFEEGQVWTYETGPLDGGSLVKIQQIETVGSRAAPVTVYHISLIGVMLYGDGVPSSVAHLPVSEKTLRDSVIALSDSDAVFPDYRPGIERWRFAEGGVFDIPLADILDVIRETIEETPKRRVIGSL